MTDIPTPTQVHMVNPNLPRQISWETPEYPEYRKHPLWFLGFAVLMALFVLYGIFTASWTTVVLFALLGVLGIFYAAQKPKIVTVTLDPTGVHINNLTYSYQVIKKFWIVYDALEVRSLYLETSAYFNHILKLELADQDPLLTKNFLKQYLEEDLDRHESFADAIARRLRF
jgi:hypothetical protein